MATVVEPGGSLLTVHQRKPGHPESSCQPSAPTLFTEVAFTAYPATDLAASRAFYENVLGLQPAMNISKEDGSGWVEYELGSHTFGVGKSDGWHHGVCCALETGNFDAAIEALRKAGTAFVMEPFDTPVCHMAMVTDPAGNKLMIHQRKPGKS
jgi:predicted enzyme related to lactoylglutathione lyase